MLKTKHLGLYQYGAFATSYTGLFYKKWIRDKDREHEPLLGTGDIQSLADLGNSYAVIEKMNALPMNPRTLLQLIVASPSAYGAAAVYCYAVERCSEGADENSGLAFI